MEERGGKKGGITVSAIPATNQFGSSFLDKVQQHIDTCHLNTFRRVGTGGDTNLSSRKILVRFTSFKVY